MLFMGWKYDCSCDELKSYVLELIGNWRCISSNCSYTLRVVEQTQETSTLQHSCLFGNDEPLTCGSLWLEVLNAPDVIPKMLITLASDTLSDSRLMSPVYFNSWKLRGKPGNLFILRNPKFISISSTNVDKAHQPMRIGPNQSQAALAFFH